MTDGRFAVGTTGHTPRGTHPEPMNARPATLDALDLAGVRTGTRLGAGCRAAKDREPVHIGAVPGIFVYSAREAVEGTSVLGIPGQSDMPRGPADR